MFGKKKKTENKQPERQEKYDFLRRKTIKELIAPAGIDASNIDHLEIISNTKRYARSFFLLFLSSAQIY